MFALPMGSTASPSGTSYTIPLSVCLSQSLVPSTPGPGAETEGPWHGQQRAGIRPQQRQGFATMMARTKGTNSANKKPRLRREEPCEAFVLAAETANVAMASTAFKMHPFWPGVPYLDVRLDFACKPSYLHMQPKAQNSTRQPSTCPTQHPQDDGHAGRTVSLPFSSAMSFNYYTPALAAPGSGVGDCNIAIMSSRNHPGDLGSGPATGCAGCLAAAKFALWSAQEHQLLLSGQLFQMGIEELKEETQLAVQPTESCQYRTQSRPGLPADRWRPARLQHCSTQQVDHLKRDINYFYRPYTQHAQQPQHQRQEEEQQDQEQDQEQGNTKYLLWPEQPRLLYPPTTLRPQPVFSSHPFICLNLNAEAADAGRSIYDPHYHLPRHHYYHPYHPYHHHHQRRQQHSRWLLPQDRPQWKWQMPPEQQEALPQWRQQGHLPRQHHHHHDYDHPFDHHDPYLDRQQQQQRQQQRRPPRTPFFAPTTPPLDADAPSECILLLCRALCMSESTTARLALHIWNRICGMVRLLVSVRPQVHSHRHGSLAVLAVDRVYSVAAVWLAAKLEESRREVPLVNTLAAVAQTLPSVLIAAELRVLHWCEWAPYKGFTPDDSHLLIDL